MLYVKSLLFMTPVPNITLEVPNTIIAKFANTVGPDGMAQNEKATTVDPDETAHFQPSHLDLQCLLSSNYYSTV